MPLLLGPHQLGQCARCGFKYQRARLKEDGYLPHLLVCGKCWEPDQPQRYPPPLRVEGLPRWTIAPEVLILGDDTVTLENDDFGPLPLMLEDGGLMQEEG